MSKAGSHENLERHDAIVGPSDRKFGFTIGIVLLLVAGWFGFSRGLGAALPWVVGSAAFLGLALTVPRLLAPLNVLWLKFGLLLHRIVSPVVMAIVFFGTVLPTGMLMRLFGKDILRLKRDPSAATYWLPRTDEQPAAVTMRQQF